ncbi:MAG: flavodoxin family protein [Candidatus Hermodarchaeota archaeon]
MIRALILYHSLFGNTKEVALSLAKGLEESGIVTDCMGIDEVQINQIPSYDFIAIGGPTHMIGLSKAMKAFLKKLKAVNLRKMKGFSFDTRNHSRMNKKHLFMLENSAAKRIEGKMKSMKIKIIKSRQSAIVYGREGPLESGVEATFNKIGKEIGSILSP